MSRASPAAKRLRFSRSTIACRARLLSLLATPSVKAAWGRLSELDVTVVEPYQEFAPTFAMFRIADPDGHVLEFAGTP